MKELALKAGAETVVTHSGFSEGGAGATDLAKAVVDGVRQAEHLQLPHARRARRVVQQIEAIATKLYGAAGIDLESQARKDLEKIEKLGLGHAPVCMAKTHLSLSHDPVAAQSARPASSCPCAASCPAPAPSSSSRCAARCSACRASARRRRS